MYMALRCMLAVLVLLAAGPGWAASGRTLDLGDGAIGYVPASAPAGQGLPVVVLLHGAGQRPRPMLEGFVGEAERHGVALVAPASKAATWDMIVEVAAERRRPSGRPFRPSLAVDLPRIEAALAAMATRVPLAADRVALAGFSDGASYALTIGTMNPATFDTIIAFSPGMGFVAPTLSSGQRIFIAHGTADPILPYEGTRDGIAAPLRNRVALKFRSFTGGHFMPRDVREDAFRYFLQETGEDHAEGS